MHAQPIFIRVDCDGLQGKLVSCPEDTYGDLPPIGNQDLLELHDGGVRTQPLVHSMLLAGVPGVEELGILIVLVSRHVYLVG